MPCHVCATIAEAAPLIREGAGAAILSEEGFLLERPSRPGDPASPRLLSSVDLLLEVLNDQPSWSDFPLILLTVAGRVTVESERLRQLRKPLGNVLLLERPIRPETLMSTLEIALRGRQRQYQIRNQMLQYAQAQEALRRSEKLAVAGRLAASIAHEINNPLESVTNLLFLMRSAPEPDTMSAYVQLAEQELARVTEIAKQTLRFYREPSHPVKVDVAQVVSSVLTLYNSRLMAAGVTVDVETCSGDTTIVSSPGELRQVIANLIGNAIDAMRRGGRIRIRLTVGTDHRREDQRCLRLVIADTGSGIPPHILSSVFEPFITTKGETGTGLGLWVTSEIVKKNGWTIRVRSRSHGEQCGTVFVISMPTQAQQPQPAPELNADMGTIQPPSERELNDAVATKVTAQQAEKRDCMTTA